MRQRSLTPAALLAQLAPSSQRQGTPRWEQGWRERGEPGLVK